MAKKKCGEWMNPFFAMFNCHINDAQTKADRAFIDKYGKGQWSRRIKPLQEAGIMDIFYQSKDEWLLFYIDSVHAFVNEGRTRPADPPEES